MAPLPRTSPQFRAGDRNVRLPITGKRIRLRRPERRDLPSLVRLLEDPSVARGTLNIPFPYRETDARAFLGRLPRGFRTGTELGLFVVDRRTDALLGGIGLHAIDPEDGTATLGYWIGRPFRRRGIASEAVSLMLRTAFGRLRLHRVEASVFPFNRASMGVLRKAGFRREGLARDAHRKNGRWVSEVRFARLSTDGSRSRNRRGGPALRRSRRPSIAGS